MEQTPLTTDTSVADPSQDPYTPHSVNDLRTAIRMGMTFSCIRKWLDRENNFPSRFSIPEDPLAND